MHHRHTSTRLLAGLLFAAGISGAAQAALNDRGGGLIYDDVLNVTWLQDANYAKTSGYDADGLMTWAAATTWAANLSYYDSVRNVTYDDWRLPTVSPINGTSFNYTSFTWTGSTDEGVNISEQGTAYAGSTASEMAHMFYNTLNNLGYITLAGSGGGCAVGLFSDTCLDNVGPFSNLQRSLYWSGTEYAPNVNYALFFDMHEGMQHNYSKHNVSFAWAVRPGDVAAVPEAETYALMLAGLGLIGWRARRRG